jgi:hypothetical protein
VDALVISFHTQLAAGRKRQLGKILKLDEDAARVSVQVGLARPSGAAGGLDRLSAQAPDPGTFDLGACSSLPTAPRALAGPPRLR